MSEWIVFELAWLYFPASEELAVFDASLFIVVAELTPVGVAAVFDKVRTHVYFKKFRQHFLLSGGVVFSPQLSELCFRLPLQHSVHIGLKYRLYVFRMQVHDQIDGGSFGDFDEIKVQPGQV